MDHIKSLLSKRVRITGLAVNVEKALAIEEFNKVLKGYFGAIIIKKVKPLYIKNGILTVACLSSVMIQELGFKKEEIIKKINDKFAKEVIRDIRFIV